jgi:hypothetical protein
MAKSTPKDYKDELDFLEKQKTAYENALNVIKQYNKANQQTKVELQSQVIESRKLIQSFNQQFKSLNDFNNLLEKTSKSYLKISDTMDDMGDKQDDSLDLFNQMDDALISIGNMIGKNNKTYDVMSDRVKTIKGITEDISKELQSGAVSNEKTREKVQEASDAYVGMNTEIMKLAKQRKKGTITESQYINALGEQSDYFKEMFDSIDMTSIKSEELLELLQAMNTESAKFSKLMMSSKDTLGVNTIQSTASSVANSAVGSLPGGGGVVDAVELAAQGAYIAAMAKLMQAAGQVILSAANVRTTAVERLGEQLQKDLDIQIQFSENVARLAGNIPTLAAAFDFDVDLMRMNAEFQAASKTAFLGSGLGSIKYGAAQLQLAGISAEQLVSTMNEMSMAGNSASKDLAVNTAIFARKTGIASGDVGQLVGQFRMLDKSGATDAFKTIEKSLSEARKEGYNVADIANELKDAGGLALEYNIRSSKELVKQVKNVREMGGSFAKIAEAGKSMVLNYKDSIKKEMQLSAMLGENVDLSEARALFAAGKNDEAFGVLKSSGILEKAQSQGLFGTQALSAALGGMDLQQLATGKFEKGDSKGIVSNQTFLNSLQDALKNLRIDVANIEITTANQRLMQIDRLENALIYSSGKVLELAAGKKQQQILTDMDMAAAATTTLTNIGLGPAGIKDEMAYGAQQLTNVPGQPGFMINKEGLDATSNLPYKSFYQLEKNPSTSLKAMQDNGYYGLQRPTYQSTTGTGGISNGMAIGIDSSNTGKNIDGQTSTLVKILDRNHKSMLQLESINISTNNMVNLTKDIRALTAVMSGLSTDSVMKLVIDGKELKTRIEKVNTQEKGKTK